MSLPLVVIACLIYAALLFAVATWAEKKARAGRSWVDNPYVFSLSLAVYCTAWTFYGSVGRAATAGMSFLAVYLGPTLLAPLWFMVLRKMILVSKKERITSIADFISSRYGKSPALGTVATLMAVFGILPYISIQLKAVTFGIDALTGSQNPLFHEQNRPFYFDAAFWVTAAMALFTIVFGARKLDPNERHEGMVAAIAFESLVKLFAFVAVGAFVVFGAFDGFGDIFSKALARPDTARLLSFSGAGTTAFAWNTLILLSALAIVMLPRQFHMAVVETDSPRHVPTAMWLFPLYLLVINIFVLPIALAGKMTFGPSVDPDTFVLTLPMHFGSNSLALVALIGGFSAATGMVIVETTALSIMFSNHVVVPLLFKIKRLGRPGDLVDGSERLLDVRRVSVLFMLVLAYFYLKTIGSSQDLVSVGLISFTAAAQFAPAALGGLYWKRGSEAGAMAGLVVGFLVWAFCLPIPSIAKAGFLPTDFIEKGLFGIGFLKPYALFGLDGLDSISHAAFWSLFLNATAFVAVSLNSKKTALNLTQADIFVNISKYTSGGGEVDFLKREAKISDLRGLLIRFLGETRAEQVFEDFEKSQPAPAAAPLEKQKNASSDLLNFAETQLAGAIGSASARMALDTIADDEPVNLDDLLRALEQTREAVERSREMEAKNAELEALTAQLTAANEKLKALDRLKADFVTTVTHELRTPVTSIKAFSKILLDNRETLEKGQQSEFLGILVSESDRIGRLINQVLDLEKLEAGAADLRFERLDLVELAEQAMSGLGPLFLEKGIETALVLAQKEPIWVNADRDRMIQVVVNLLSNAQKFCPATGGKIRLELAEKMGEAELLVIDNGPGIPLDQQAHVFGQFTQIALADGGKPTGTGLGLFITKRIVELHGGTVFLRSAAGEGAVFGVRLGAG